MVTDFLPNIDATRCIGCELCAKFCPNQVFTVINNLATIVNPIACDYHSACQEICPTEAINLTYQLIFSAQQDLMWLTR
jgi:formate hydrogenlyase subunit 6/NADH:ubiquinone oxidoreductase subunit I